MRPTRRGYAAVGVVALAVAMALGAGPRSLNAVAAPVLVALVAGAVQVRRAPVPTVERTTPRRGFPGERRTVELTVEGGGVGRITESVSEGLSADVDVERSLPTTVEYELAYERRGVHEIGPTTVRVRDVLGLFETEYEPSTRTEVLVYPHVYATGDLESTLRALGPESDDRSEFDRIREYVPGDSLRDVNWKASAKYDDMLVTEFSDPADEEAVSVAAASAPGHADELATAVATLVVAAVRLGLAVELTLPDGHLGQGYGETHRKRALELLARTEGGEAPADAWEAADVRVRAGDGGVSVTIDRTVHDLSELTASRDNPLLTEVRA